MEYVKADISGAGDMSVGIFPQSATLDTGMASDDLKEIKEEVRTKISELYALMWDEPVQVIFDDECPECGNPLDFDDSCPNKNCLNNMEY